MIQGLCTFRTNSLQERPQDQCVFVKRLSLARLSTTDHIRMRVRPNDPKNPILYNDLKIVAGAGPPDDQIARLEELLSNGSDFGRQISFDDTPVTTKSGPEWHSVLYSELFRLA